MNRRLYRCRHNRRLAGVAAGVAEFFDLDPTLVRVLWFLSTFFYGLGLVLYIGMAIIVPVEPVPVEPVPVDASTEATAVPDASEGHRHAARGDGPWTTFLGFALILFGSLALAHSILPAWELARYVVPAATIGLGAFLVAKAVRREPMKS